MTWSSAPPPIPPRTFSTEPPPPASEPLTPVYDVSDDEERTKVDLVRQADAVREEARALVRGMVEEALAPLHYALKDLERRLGELERRPVAPPPQSPPRVVAAAPVPPPLPPQPPGPLYTAPSPAPPLVMAREAPPPLEAAAVSSLPRPVPDVRPRAESFDVMVPFDGARRRRRVVVSFLFVILLLFGAVFAAMIWSRVR